MPSSNVPREVLEHAVLVLLVELLEGLAVVVVRDPVELTNALAVDLLHVGHAGAPGVRQPAAHLKKAAAVRRRVDVADAGQVAIDEADHARLAGARVMVGGDDARARGVDRLPLVVGEEQAALVVGIDGTADGGPVGLADRHRSLLSG
jgi:hypothetical protein